MAFNCSQLQTWVQAARSNTEAHGQCLSQSVETPTRWTLSATNKIANPTIIYDRRWAATQQASPYTLKNTQL